jgi:outer membrane lipopolysaccharide assembly protein LptE/RlpB
VIHPDSRLPKHWRSRRIPFRLHYGIGFHFFVDSNIAEVLAITWSTTLVLFDLHSKKNSNISPPRDQESIKSTHFQAKRTDSTRNPSNFNNSRQITNGLPKIQVIIINIAERVHFRKLEAEYGSWRTTTVETERILQEIQVILTSEARLHFPQNERILQEIQVILTINRREKVHFHKTNEFCRKSK